jgi:drug/metabolite transporter (DMT)-like permease
VELSLTVLLGVICALGSAVLYCTGAALQALEARRTPDQEALHASLLRDLASRPRWLLGTASVLVGWSLQAVALLFAPVTVVQPTLAAGLVLLLAVGTRVLGERVGRREVLGMAAIVIGVAGLATTAPQSSTERAEPQLLAAVLAGLALVALIPYLLRSSDRSLGGLVIASGGVAYAVCGLATSFAGDALPQGHWLALGFWLAVTGGAALVGLVSEMTAFQHAPVTHVFPVMLVIQMILAVLLAPVLGGESWAGTPLNGVALAASIAVVAGGAAALVGTPALGAALATSRGKGN